MEKSVNPGGLFSFLNKDIKLFGSKYNDNKKVELFTELNILLSSGIDIRTSLDLIIETQRKEEDKEVFRKIRDKIISGITFSESIKDSNKFSTYDSICLRIGEETGRLSEIFFDVSQYYAFRIKHKRHLYNSLSYPIMVFLTSIVAVFFMMNVIVPMFSEVFKRFGGELPPLTQLIINISSALKENLFLIFLIVTGFIVLIVYSRKKDWFRKLSAEIILNLPVVNKIINKIYLSRFCQSMGLLTSAHVPMVQSINLVRQMIGFYPYEIALGKIAEDILKGKHLYESMAKFKIFELKLVTLIKVAEEVNQLDTMFIKLNKQYGDDLENSIGMLTTFLEPLLIIFVGILVAVILIAMYLPLFQMSTSVS
jgi:type IV pilus assembly protein PilC